MAIAYPLVLLALLSAPGAVPAARWPSGVSHVFVRATRVQGPATDVMYFYWRRENAIAVLGHANTYRMSRQKCRPHEALPSCAALSVLTDSGSAFAGGFSDGKWCHELDHGPSTGSVTITVDSMLNHWLSRLALDAWKRKPLVITLHTSEGLAEVPLTAKYSQAGFPTELSGSAPDGKSSARVEIFYRSPNPGELPLPVPWLLDPNQPVVPPRSEKCALLIKQRRDEARPWYEAARREEAERALRERASPPDPSK